MDAPRPTSEGGQDDSDTTLDAQVQGQLQAPGATHASHDVARVAGAQVEGSPTSELAADVRAALDGGLPLLYPEDRKNRRDKAEAALDALVARVTDLEAQVAAAGDNTTEPA